MTKNDDPLSINLLRTQRYGLFWISSLFSNMGTWMQQVAQPWVVLTISNSSFWVGLDNFAMNAPAWIFILWGGVLADRRDRKNVILFFQAIQMFCVIGLVTLLLLGLLKVWMIILISFLVGTTDALSMPSFQSIIPSLVKPKDIPRAVALNSTQFNLSRILGPMIAGIVMTRYGAVACFGANAFSYIPFFLSLYWIYPKKNSKPLATSIIVKSEPENQKFQEILKEPDVRSSLSTVLITSLFCSSLVTFCPVLIKDLFHANAADFGTTMTAFGIGGLFGAGITLLPINSLKLNKFSILTAILLGLIVIGVALNRSLLILNILFVLAGAALTISNVFANSFLQVQASDQTRGRVASLYQLAMHGGMSLGSLMTGVATAYWGISTSFLINGVLAFILHTTILKMQRSN